jgi:hypothetical protein
MNQEPSPRTRRLLWAVFPAGVVLLITWIVLIAARVATGASHEISVVSAILGLITALILIVTGLNYRRALRRP